MSTAQNSDVVDSLRRRVGDLLDRGLEAGLQVPQDTGMLHIDQGALTSVLELVEGTIETLADLATACEQGLEFDASEVTLPPEQLGDLAFVARSELVEIRGALQSSLDQDSKWQIAAQADRAAGRSVRALLPVESALREYQGLEVIQRVWFDLDDTLKIRRRFIRFWLEAHRIDTPPQDELRPALERLAMMIDDLRQDAIYPFLRLDDRLDVRALQKRILAWLQGPQDKNGTTEDPVEDSSEDLSKDRDGSGRRLWQDASGFFNLLMHIQRREELREHDLVQLGRVLRRLQDGESRLGSMDTETHAEFRELLLDMASREPALDAILIADEPVSSDTLVAAVRKLHQKLLQR